MKIGTPSDVVVAYRAGAAVLYFGSGSGLSSGPSWADQGTTTQERFGHIVDGTGDVNGDGFGDVLVISRGSVDTAWVYLGSGAGLRSTPDWSEIRARASSTRLRSI